AADRIRDPREHDRNCAGHLLQSRYDRIGRDEDYIRRHRHHFRGRDAHTLGAFAGEPVIELDVVALGPTEFVEPLSESRKVGLPDFIVLGKAHDHADAPQPLALLRARRQRPCRSRTADKRDELAPSHSITSSARSRKDSGTFNPIALAVLRLTTSSNFTGCSTGRSAGLVPCKILCT